MTVIELVDLYVTDQISLSSVNKFIYRVPVDVFMRIDKIMLINYSAYSTKFYAYGSPEGYPPNPQNAFAPGMSVSANSTMVVNFGMLFPSGTDIYLGASANNRLTGRINGILMRKET